MEISYSTWLSFGVDQGWVTVNQEDPTLDDVLDGEIVE